VTNVTADGAAVSGTFNGVRPGYSPGQFGYLKFDSWVPEALQGNPSWLPYPPWAGEDYFATLLAEVTNPSRPHVSLPVSIAEMRDIPQLMRTYGETLIKPPKVGIAKKLAEHNLAFQFGLKPLVRDLARVFDIHDKVERRVAEIKALESGDGFKRNATLSDFKDTTTTAGLNFDGSIGMSTKGTQTIESARKVWGSIRWKPSYYGKLPHGNAEQVKLARRLVLGLHYSQITQNVWNSLPWTWLVDWFYDVGSFLGANNNIIGHLPLRVCIMNFGYRRETWTDLYLAGSPGEPIPDWVGATGPFERTGKYWKQRFVPFVPSTPIARIPFLGSGTLSILASLAILRSRRGYRN
jgi:hypothetical protein